MRKFLAALAIVTVLTASAAFAGVFGGSSSGLSVGLANTLYCQLTGGVGCTLTGDLKFNNGAANGIITTQSGASVLAMLSNGGAGGAVRTNSVNVSLGVQGTPAATTTIAQVASGIGSGTGGSAVVQWRMGGMQSVVTQQSVSCAAGVLALDPTSSVVYVNANSAACVITLGEANAITGSDVEIVLTSNVSGAVTFPNVANVHAGPIACTTTGLSTIGSSYRIHYAAVLNEYVGVACNSN